MATSTKPPVSKVHAWYMVIYVSHHSLFEYEVIRIEGVEIVISIWIFMWSEYVNIDYNDNNNYQQTL